MPGPVSPACSNIERYPLLSQISFLPLNSNRFEFVPYF
jgi:hypothetical protein